MVPEIVIKLLFKVMVLFPPSVELKVPAVMFFELLLKIPLVILIPCVVVKLSNKVTPFVPVEPVKTKLFAHVRVFEVNIEPAAVENILIAPE